MTKPRCSTYHSASFLGSGEAIAACSKPLKNINRFYPSGIARWGRERRFNPGFPDPPSQRQDFFAIRVESDPPFLDVGLHGQQRYLGRTVSNVNVSVGQLPGAAAFQEVVHVVQRDVART